MNEVFSIKTVSIKNNFVYFSESSLKKINIGGFKNDEPRVFKLQGDHGSKDVHVLTLSPVGRAGLADWEVGLSNTVAKSLNLQEGSTVTLVPIKVAIPVAKHVCVSPASEEDFEVLQLNSLNIQDHLLNQLQVVKIRQPFVVWPTPHLHITLIPESSMPNVEVVVLNNSTELHVNPQVYRPTDGHESSSDHLPRPSLSWSGLKNSLLGWISGQPENSKTDMTSAEDHQEIIFRVHPRPEQNEEFCGIIVHPKHAPTYECARMEILWPLNNDDPKYFNAQIVRSDSVTAEELFSKFPVAYLNLENYTKYKIQSGCKIACKPLTGDNSCDLIIYNVEGSDGKGILPDKVREVLLNQARSRGGVLLLISGSELKVDEFKGVIELNNEVAVLTTAQIEKCDINVYPADSKWSTNSKSTETSNVLSPLLIQGWNYIFKEILFSICNNLERQTFRSIIVLKGQPGTGKSFLVSMLRQELNKNPTFTHWQVADCRLLKGKQVDNLRSYFLKSFQECVRLQPSVILLENLEVFSPPKTTESKESAEASYCLSIQELIWEMSVACFSLHKVCVLVTTSSDDSFSSINDTTPVEHFSMPELSLDDKQQALDHFLNSGDIKCDQELQKKILKMTEGYRIQDLKDLSDRITFNMWKNTDNNSECPAVIGKGDVIAGLSDFVPQGMQGVKLFSSRTCTTLLGEDRESEVKWANVGGLEEVKRNLTELIEWPSKYPELFAEAPLKLQTGVVLYGMPGSGKTLMAAELARSSGANFISVKGPELLSMYIGASEQGVRDLFDKAHAAKPCILFFDEFDSLAPSRGRDTTGVSDRVVNQLLTSLDGVDSPVDAGVWVVAATSRPDLLDKALLRPGRLDTILHCPFPTKEERFEILKLQTRLLQLSDDVNLYYVAENTPGYSGADLQAVLYTAQLAALEEIVGDLQLENSRGPESHDSEVNIKIRQEHLTEALVKSRPSLSTAEVNRYQRIYDEFEKSRLPGEARNFIPAQKTALA